MTDEELVQGILDGCSLRTFMVPDPSIPTNHPEHMESYNLPHVIINGDMFWGKTENSHLVYHLGKAPFTGQSYCYTNMGGFFCAYSTKEGSTKKGLVGIMRKDRYKTHEWKLVRKHRLVWDSGGDQPAEAVAEDIEAGAKFKIAMLDGEGIWNTHPVDLPMFETKSKRFELRTVWDCYPTFFRSKFYLDEAIAYIDKLEREKLMPILDRGKLIPILEREKLMPIDTPMFECFYSVFPDGTYYNFYDIQRKSKHGYERLKVFSDNVR